MEDRREVNPGMLGLGLEGEDGRDGKASNGGGGSWDEHGHDVDLERGRV